MTIGEYYEQQQRQRGQELPHECANCYDMPKCWVKDPCIDWSTRDKECWKPRPVPHYIKDIEMK